MASLPMRFEAPLHRPSGRDVQGTCYAMRAKSSTRTLNLHGMTSIVGSRSLRPLRVAHRARKDVFERNRHLVGQSLKCAVLAGLHQMMPLAFLSPQAFILEGIFSMVALAIGAAFTFAFGGALMAGAATTIAFAMAIGGLLWVGMFLAVALPVMLIAGGVGTFMLYRMTQPEESKKLREQARKQMLEFEKRFGGSTGAAGFQKGKVIDVQVESEIDPEVLNRKREVEQDLSDFDRRLRGRFFD